ncbi:MAG: DMT family transporter [Gammaproteobacteria bacterium]
MTTHSDRPHNLLAGVGLMLLSTLFFSISDALGKWLTTLYSISQIAFIRCVVGVIILLSLMLYSARLGDLKSSRPGWHIVRSLVSTAVLFAMFYGLRHLPLAEFVALCFSIPFFIALTSPWFLNEHVDRQSWIAIIVGFIGILIILRPSPEHLHLAHLVTLLLAFAVALLIVSARYLMDTENFHSINFYIYPASLLLFGIDSTYRWIPPNPAHWLALISLGVCTTIALACYIQANRHARPAVVAPIDYIRMIWIILLGYYFWGEIPDLYTCIGMVIIIVSGIYVVRHTGTTPEVYSAQGLGDEGIESIDE